MEWEVGLIEWIQKTLGSLNGTIGSVLSFIGGETGAADHSFLLEKGKRKAPGFDHRGGKHLAADDQEITEGN